MRFEYTPAEMEIISFESEDIITASFLNGGDGSDIGGADITF